MSVCLCVYFYLLRLKMPRRRCVACGRALVAFGSWRSNGADHEDWAERTLHKKCYIAGEYDVQQKKVRRYEVQHKWKVLTFGKYNGLNVRQVGDQDEGYLRWMKRATNLTGYFPDIDLYFEIYKS